MIIIPRYDIKVTVLRLQMLTEDLPAHFNTPALAGSSVGGTAHLCGSDGGLRDIHDVGVTVIIKQLQQRNVRAFKGLNVSRHPPLMSFLTALLSEAEP